MGRRKSRSVSPSKSKATKKLKTSPPLASFDKNPFRIIYGQDSRPACVGKNNHDRIYDESNMDIDVEKDVKMNEAEGIFDEMLLFTELSIKKKTSHDAATIDAAGTEKEEEKRKILMEKTVRNLLRYMLETPDDSNETKDRRAAEIPATTTGGFVSAKDIARLLLPWSVRGILHMEYKKKTSTSASASAVQVGISSEVIYWKTLDGCLAFFFDHPEQGGSSKPSARSNKNYNALTLSTMHKIMPIALSLALEEGELKLERIEARKDKLDTVQNLAKGSYCRLADHLYRPPFDVVCDSLLPILATGEKKNKDPQMIAIWLSVTISTLRLMNLRIASANPKKSFQLLVRSKVFLDLAIVHDCAQSCKPSQEEQLESLKNHFDDLIRNGMFSLEHHMEGFRSLQLAVPTLDSKGQKQKGDTERNVTSTTANAKSSFRGYQEGLFNTLEGFLNAENEEGNANRVSSTDVIAVSFMSPLLLNIFFEQASKIQEQQAASKSYKKNKGTNKICQLQFRFFSCVSGYLLRGLLASKETIAKMQIHNRGVRLSLFEMLGKNLDLLLRHNIYQPSLGNNIERSFLDRIGKETVQCISAYEVENENRLTFAEWKKALMILDVLTRLNHTILHEQLPEVLAVCLTYSSQDQSNKSTFHTSPKQRIFYYNYSLPSRLPLPISFV